ncbi:MAG TPA: rhomboid family intramembrane serine protease [Pyrinomonadaceae bacterium]|jgi:membrane associated rhomboid family serine protease|nr:rhomboid family intramembrane serine protease [Pyrinomonadaceae bacterium]
MCRNCGAIVGAGEPQCAVCGTPNAQSPERLQNYRPADRETIRFARAILSRPNIFTIVVLIANLFVFMLMWQSSGMNSQVLWQGFPEPVLAAYGAKLNYLINAPHYQWWRFITPMFVHVNLPHLLVNMYSLWIVGPYVEKLYGPAKFIVFWVLTGIAGVVGSYLSVQPRLATGGFGRFLFKTADIPSAGASGALFGLVGVLFIFGIKFRRELPEGFRRAFGTGMLPIIIINLFIGYIGRGFIDNAAHLGGLLSGAALATVVQYRRVGERRGLATAWRVLQVVALSVVALAFYKTGRNFNRSLQLASLPALNHQAQLFLSYVGTMNALREKTAAVIKDRDLSNVSGLTQLAVQAPAPDARAAELRERLVSILSRVASAVASASPPPGNGPRLPPPVDQKLVDEFQQWNIDYDQWLAGPGKH